MSLPRRRAGSRARGDRRRRLDDHAAILAGDGRICRSVLWIPIGQARQLEGRPAHRYTEGARESSGGRRRGCRACAPSDATTRPKQPVALAGDVRRSVLACVAESQPPHMPRYPRRAKKPSGLRCCPCAASSATALGTSCAVCSDRLRARRRHRDVRREARALQRRGSRRRAGARGQAEVEDCQLEAGGLNEGTGGRTRRSGLTPMCPVSP
jgi:hypothetical protein